MNFVSSPFSYASVQNGEGLNIPSLPRAALQTKTLLRNAILFFVPSCVSKLPPKVLKTKKSMFAHALLFAEREGFEPPEV